jgi:hypothetical protein
LQRGEHALRAAFELHGGGGAFALAVIEHLGEIHLAWHELPAASSIRRRVTGNVAVRIHDGIAVRIVIAAVAEGADSLHHHALALSLDVRIGVVDHRAEPAAGDIPDIAVDTRAFVSHIVTAVAIVRAAREREHLPLRIKRHARAQIHRACDPAFDHLGGLVLIRVDARHQLGGDIIEIQTAIAVRRKAVAPVELGAHESQPANENARGLRRKMRAVFAGLQPAHGDAGHTLESFGRGLIGKRADVRGGDGVYERVGLHFDLLRRLEGLAHADHHHLLQTLLGLRRTACASHTGAHGSAINLMLTALTPHPFFCRPVYDELGGVFPQRVPDPR